MTGVQTCALPISYANLDEFFRLADDSEADWEHTVSWIDCITGGGGRGLFMRGNPTNAEDRPAPHGRKLTMPMVPPVSLVNRLSLRPFNMAYYHLKKWQAGRAITHYESFFYPLDNLLEWNRMYGPKGFFQYQSVVPREVGQDAVQAMLKEIARSGDGSFLAVLKTFGNRQPVGMMSFPQPGVTLALDFPNRGERTHKLFERLEAIVREARDSLKRIYHEITDLKKVRMQFENNLKALITSHLTMLDQGQKIMPNPIIENKVGEVQLSGGDEAALKARITEALQKKMVDL